MQLYLESANLDEINEALELSALDGVLVPPGEVLRQGLDYSEQVARVCQVVQGAVYVDVTGHFLQDMLAEATVLASISAQVVVRLPATKAGMKTLRQLVRRKARVNISLCFTTAQAMVAARAGAVSVTLCYGGSQKESEQGNKLVSKSRRVFGNYGLESELIVSSIATPEELADAAVAGADAAFVRFGVIQQMLSNPQTEERFAAILMDLRQMDRPHVQRPRG